MIEDKKAGNGTIIRVVKNNNYTVISNVYLRNKNLSFKAKGLMSVCLSLPDNWHYTLAGLQGLATDGRTSVGNALKELQKFGFLTVERERNEQGLFKTIYTFYENPQETGISSSAENPQWITHNGLHAADNIQLLNTNNKELILNTQIIENIFKPVDLYNLYKKICIHYPQPVEFTDARKKKAAIRLKKRPQKEFWVKTFKNAEKSLFVRKTTFFTFDWILKNDENPLKVYEGNYNQQEIKEETALSDNGGKYAKCYG